MRIFSSFKGHTGTIICAVFIGFVGKECRSAGSRSTIYVGSVRRPTASNPGSSYTSIRDSECKAQWLHRNRRILGTSKVIFKQVEVRREKYVYSLIIPPVLTMTAPRGSLG
jgi:hypothetical protein